MNPIIAYELAYIPFDELEVVLWDFTIDEILEVGEKHYAFYLSKANKFHNYSFYIKKYGSDLYAESEWFCE